MLSVIFVESADVTVIKKLKFKILGSQILVRCLEASVV